ncbi:MAG TPA: TrkH family potassium uptake protein [Phaeodactylibacter sp.]|nr:TrkH family potassium uptake protein [Phaeodactylibacter sp.]
MLKFRVVSKIVGVLLIVLGTLMLTALPFSFYYQSGDAGAISGAALITIMVGAFLWWYQSSDEKNVGKREGYLIVSLGWLAMSLFSTLPYLLSGQMPDLAHAFFESVSGLTTTGASVINDIEAVPKGILFWRSMTQWIGGMGIIVLTVALLPLLGIGGVELFVAEAPGPTSDKIHPRIKETAKRLWGLYVGITVLLGVLLYFSGMNFYDAINHALTTMATGGFSTKNASIAYYNTPLIQYILAFFMFIAGTNYTIIYFGAKGNFKRVWKSDEFKTYLGLVLFLMILTTLMVHSATDNPFEQSFRDASFQVISLITTTGFVSADYTSWSPTLTLIFFSLLFVGASAGSTAGGIKIIRHLALVKNTLLEFKRLLHPRALVRTKIDKQIVAPRVMTHILVFLLIYLGIFFFGSIIMTVILSDFEYPLLTAMGATATAIGNVGPGIGEVGPVNNFFAIPNSGKWFLSFLMLLGRLELFTILILFMPYFWKAN